MYILQLTVPRSTRTSSPAFRRMRSELQYIVTGKEGMSMAARQVRNVFYCN